MNRKKKADPLKKQLDYKKYQPILADVNKYYEDQGFVGDYKTRMTLPIAIIRRKCVGVVSGSGSGKTAVIDAIKEAFDENQIYTMGSGSDKAQVYEADRINNAHMINITELQKMASGDTAIEMLKDLGEGKDYDYKRTNSDQSVSKKTIKAGKAIVYTKAIENNFESDAELDRRFPRLTTDMSESQNRRVIESKAQRRTNPLRKSILGTTQRNALEAHLSALLKEDANKYTFVNPMAGFLGEIIPSTFAISRTYTDHYLDFIEGVAFFNKHDRIIKEYEDEDGDKHKVIFVSPEDCWQLHEVYSEQFLQDVLNIPPNGIHVLEALRKNKPQRDPKKSGAFFAQEQDTRPKLTIGEIFAALQKEGITMPEPIIKKILIALMMSGYVIQELDTSGPKKKEYYILNSDISDFQDEIDWQKGINESVKMIGEEYPDIAKEYIEKYCANAIATDPWSGEKIEIATGKKELESIEDNRDNWMVQLND